MREIIEILQALLQLAIAATVLVSLLQTRKNGRASKRIERELKNNPHASAEAVMKKVNGSGLLTIVPVVLPPIPPPATTPPATTSPAGP